MTIIIESYTIPEKGKVDINVKRSFEIKVSAEEARREVRWWLRDEVSMLIDAEVQSKGATRICCWPAPYLKNLMKSRFQTLRPYI